MQIPCLFVVNTLRWKKVAMADNTVRYFKMARLIALGHTLIGTLPFIAGAIDRSSEEFWTGKIGFGLWCGTWMWITGILGIAGTSREKTSSSKSHPTSGMYRTARGVSAGYVSLAQGPDDGPVDMPVQEAGGVGTFPDGQPQGVPMVQVSGQPQASQVSWAEGFEEQLQMVPGHMQATQTVMTSAPEMQIDHGAEGDPCDDLKKANVLFSLSDAVIFRSFYFFINLLT
ncbi:hypothetical protein P5673_030688 [Acropora cervicornis]|uniref:Uncharacterized protein n=1 Tax=Acropora cervicornis TaxID=6130 RepID=A0AAD9UTE1_ACRCE|nr:hypothetical protein P5673_030688 [Acropora cervicornis]